MSESIDKRELNLEEMDKVSGGGSFPDDYRINGYTAEEAGSILQGVYDQFGLDIAENVAIEMFGIKTPDWRKFMKESAGRNEGYYAVSMIWEKGYHSNDGGFGSGY